MSYLVGAMAPGNSQFQTWQQPDDVRPVATFNFTFTYSCLAETGGGFGQTAPSGAATVDFGSDPNVSNGWQMRPWEPQDIILRGVKWAVLSGTAPYWFSIGNAARPDLFGGPWASIAGGAHQFAADAGWPWPSKSEFSPNDYMDVHGVGLVGSSGTIQIVFEYEPRGPVPTPLPCAWNPNDKGPEIVLSNSNLSACGDAGIVRSVRCMLGRNSGKYMWENKVINRTGATSLAGWASVLASMWTYIGNSPISIGVQATNGQTSVNGMASSQNYLQPFAINDVMALAIDLSAGKGWLGKNTAWYGSGDPVAGTNPWFTFTPGLKLWPAFASANADNSGAANFGGSAFTMTLPTGFSAWGD